MTTTVSRADLSLLLAEYAPEADALIAVMRMNQITAVVSGDTTSDAAWRSWCRTRGIPDVVRDAYAKRIYDYYAEFSEFDLTVDQVGYRALSSLDSFYQSIPPHNGARITEHDIAPLVALNWVHTFGYPSFRTGDCGADDLAQWHHLCPNAWPLAAAGFTPAEYVTAAANGVAPSREDAKVLAALRGYHFLPEIDQT